MPAHRTLSAAALIAAAMVLSGCATGTGSSIDDGRLRVVASTAVYGQLADVVGGEHVDVESIVSSPAHDPHEYELTAIDRLEASRAQLFVQNGGGYDAFMTPLTAHAAAPIVTAFESEDVHDHDAADGLHEHGAENEHIWYSPDEMADVADRLAAAMSDLRPADALDFTANAQAFRRDISGLNGRLSSLRAQYAGTRIFVTEPLPLYLTEAAGLVNAAPAKFTQAVEGGQDVPPATLLSSMKMLDAHDVKLIIVNVQAGGAETTMITERARDRGIPVISFSEMLPAGSSYIDWMQQNISTLTKALRQ